MMRALVIIPVAVAAIGCGGAKATTGSSAGQEGEEIVLGRIDGNASCETEGRRESFIDLNQDGVPEVRKVYRKAADGEVLVCREADLNFDGKKDTFMFFNDDGQIERDEADHNYDGNIDIVLTYVEGKVTKQDFDTNSDGLVDSVRYLEDDMPVRVEDDTDGDGRVDYWEYYESGELVRIGVDQDGDGRVDNWSQGEDVESAARDVEEKSHALN